MLLRQQSFKGMSNTWDSLILSLNGLFDVYPLQLLISNVRFCYFSKCLSQNFLIFPFKKFEISPLAMSSPFVMEEDLKRVLNWWGYVPL